MLAMQVYQPGHMIRHVSILATRSCGYHTKSEAIHNHGILELLHGHCINEMTHVLQSPSLCYHFLWSRVFASMFHPPRIVAPLLYLYSPSLPIVPWWQSPPLITRHLGPFLQGKENVGPLQKQFEYDHWWMAKILFVVDPR